MIPTHTFQEPPSQQATLRSHWIVIGLTIVCLALLGPRTVSGQASAGMTGTITDSSGAVVPNANITVTNQGTSVSDKTVSGSAGTYSFRGLPPGKYKVTVEAAGFKTNVQDNVTVEVSTTPTVNITLATGATSETVQVTADQVSLNTTQPEMGSTIEPVVVQALPNEVSGRGRQVDALQFLAPGTTGCYLLPSCQRRRRLRAGNRLQRRSSTAAGDRRLHHQLQPSIRTGSGVPCGAFHLLRSVWPGQGRSHLPDDVGYEQISRRYLLD